MSPRLRWNLSDNRMSIIHWSVVWHLSSIYFKQCLLNYWVKFRQTLQKWTLDGPLSKILKDFYSMQNSGCLGNQNENKKSSQKLTGWFENRLAQMVLLWLSTKIVQIILREKSLAIFFEDSQFIRNRSFSFIVSKIYLDKHSWERWH